MSIQNEINIKECLTLEELADCVRLQEEVFALPDVELSPVRHFIVTKNAGGFTLGAFYKSKLVGFTLSVPAITRGEKSFYSHMTAVDKDFQSFGIGGKLKWKQREKSLKLGVKLIKWTFQPVLARNAYFNLEKLGVSITKYAPNFYGTDYSTTPDHKENLGFDSDRLFAEWNLESKKVKAIVNKEHFVEKREIQKEIILTNDWNKMFLESPKKAIELQKHLKTEFQIAFNEGLVCEGFHRDKVEPRYLFY